MHGALPDPAVSTRGLMDTPEKVAGLLDSAGFRILSLRIGPWRQPMTVEQVVALRTSLGAPGDDWHRWSPRLEMPVCAVLGNGSASLMVKHSPITTMSSTRPQLRRCHCTPRRDPGKRLDRAGGCDVLFTARGYDGETV
jgi:hypothetical protein